ncbi:MAG TPA: hypothetical protein VIM53_03980 [Candidatus Saccharimonadales bacterium]
MHKLKRLPYLLSTLVIIMTFVATSQQASAVVPQSERCTPVGTILNTTGCHGYAFNDTMFWTSTDGINGGPVIYSASQYAIPFTVNSAATLESFMYGLLGMSSPTDYSYNYNKEGAAFIIATMLGHVGGGTGDFGNATNMIAYAKQNFYPTAANGYKGWTTIIDYYGSGLNSNYSINWGSTTTSTTLGSGTVNTMHACPPGTSSSVCQPTPGAAPSGSADSENFAWYALAPGETETTHPIVFQGPKTAQNPSGVTYTIRRECGNPIGGPAWPDTQPGNGVPSGNYSLTPNIQVSINGSTSSAGSVAQAGDTITFNYYIDNNSGSDDTTSTACTAASQTFSGYHQQPGTPETLTGSGTPATTCPQTFAASPTQHQVVTNNSDTLTAADGKTYCRTLTVNPSSASGGSQTVESCIYVASKPYVKVFGGDVSAGTAFASSTGACTDDTNAQILSWNTLGAGYPGAGAQYAAYALNAITNFATNQNGAGAGAPSSLAFANTTASGSSIFGGSLGSWPCMPDYYDSVPSSGTSGLSGTVNVSSLTGSTAYTSSAGLTFTAGNVNPNSRIQVYVNGDVYISGNITYAGSWSVKTMPLLEIIARGNIYIASGVTQLDGLYIAQPNGASGGTIYTCATGAGAPADTSSSTYYSTCNNKLTVNGSLLANTVQLLRTAGTVNSSSTGDTATSNSAAESINGSPAFWIPSTATTSTSSGTLTPGSYDYIESLPPIL